MFAHFVLLVAVLLTILFLYRLWITRRTLAQRRKGAKRYRVSKSFLCAFAPLREKKVRTEVFRGDLSTFRQSDFSGKATEEQMWREQLARVSSSHSVLP